MDMKTFQKLLRRLVLFPAIILALEGLWLLKRAYELVCSLYFKKVAPAVVRTPEERFKDLPAAGYPFQPNYVDLPIGGGKTLPRVHYVDEGRKDATEVILCLHGEPSWSFLYRHMIPVFVNAGYRVIAPDFIGFGKSDKFVDPDSYSHDMHTMTLRLFLDHLNIQGMTLVCQDWGGLTGLSVVKDCPHYFSRLVIMNTGLPTGTEITIKKFYKGTPFLMWRSVAHFFGTWLPVRYVFQFALLKPEAKVLDAYCAPFPSSLFKGGPAKWPLLVPVTCCSNVATDMQATRDFLADKWKKSALVMFADRDAITRAEEKTFLKLLPAAVSKTVHDAGHFLQEDKGVEVASHIVSFINGKL